MNQPDCPFCGAPWSAAMRAILDAHSAGPGCACCMPLDNGKRPASLPSAFRDLCCDHCGNIIYSAPMQRSTLPGLD